MSERFVMNEDIFEKAINILENRSFLDKQDSKQILLNGLSQIDHFKTLMRDPSLQHHLYPYLEEFASQVTYKPIPEGRIIFHDTENINQLYFVMRGSFVEFQPKSENDLEQELYWSSQTSMYKEQLTQVQKNQFELQERKKLQILEMQKIQASQSKYNNFNNINSDSNRGGDTQNTVTAQSQQNQSNNQNKQKNQQMSQQQMQQSQVQQKKQINKQQQQQDQEEIKPVRRVKVKDQINQPRKSGSLEEIFFTDEFKEKQQKLKSMNELYQETTKFYQGMEYENLLKIENKYQERYFKDNRCLYKKSRIFQAGMCFGELHDQNETTQKRNQSIIEKKNHVIGSTVVCSKKAFLLSIPCKVYQRIFSKLTEQINFIFHVLANTFQSVKKVILHDFAFQFTEQNLEFNEVLFHQGEQCKFVYIMKTGEIDYRKQINTNGEFHEKRIGMINQGELFGHEDIFNLSRNYSVYSCVNNSIVYRIKKDVIMISQFMEPLKQAVKSKSEYLSKRLTELYAKNSDSPYNNNINNDNQDFEQLNNNHNNSKLNKGQASNNNQLQVSFKMESKMNNNNNKMLMGQSLTSIPSLMNIGSSNSLQPQQSQTLQHIQNQGYNAFNNAKNTNFGENDYNLTFKSMTKLELLHSNSSITTTTKNTDNSKGTSSSNNIASFNSQDNLKNKQKTNVNVVQTTRAQPESIYSRIIRPDSAFKEEIDQMKKEQQAQLQRFNNHDNFSATQSGFHDLNNSSKMLSFNRFKRREDLNNSQTQFKLNKMSKDMFSLQMAINSDEKLKKKYTIKNIKAEQEEQQKNYQIQQNYNNNNNNKSNSPMKNKQNNQESENIEQTQIPSMNSIPIRGTTSSLIRYKEQVKDYFVKDNSKSQKLDFFMEFQNYKQAITAKQLYDKMNKLEVKEDPYSHIDFNVTQNQTPISQTYSNQSISTTNNGKTTNSQQKNGLPQSSFKQINFSESLLISEQKSKNNNYINDQDNNDDDDQQQQQSQGQNDSQIRNLYNSKTIKSSSLLSDQLQNTSDKTNLIKDLMKRSQSSSNTNRKIHFSSQNSINSYPVNSKISHFNQNNNNNNNNNGYNNTYSSYNQTNKFIKESVPIQLRDIPYKNNESFNKNNQNNNNGKQGLYQQNQNAEVDIGNSYSNALSFGNLRKSNGLRLGAQLHLTSSRDIQLRK